MTSPVAMVLAAASEGGQTGTHLGPVRGRLQAFRGRHLRETELVGALQKSCLSQRHQQHRPH